MQLNDGQIKALEILNSEDNIFLSGVAGSGKSTLLKSYLEDRDVPILASTGAAAILIGGRTFNSFFGLGIMRGGHEATVRDALRNRFTVDRLRSSDEVVIDEISMISGPTLACAEEITRLARRNSEPWGGMRIIAVGDFAQLPPVNPHSKIREWAFMSPTWEQSKFRPAVLNEVMRASDPDLLHALNKMRTGIVDSKTISFLTSRTVADVDSTVTRLLGKRDSVEKYNVQKLEELPGELRTFETQYSGNDDEAVERKKKDFPIPKLLQLKVGALVMLRVNDADGMYANGSVGLITDFRAETEDHSEAIKIKMANGFDIVLKKHTFEALDANGAVIARAKNYPLSLAWAITIHKAQGITLDNAHVDIKFCWEPGQAYVACSRVRSAEGLSLIGWTKKSIFADSNVYNFHKKIGMH